MPRRELSRHSRPFGSKRWPIRRCQRTAPAAASSGNFALTDFKVRAKAAEAGCADGRQAAESAGHVRAEGSAGRRGDRRERNERLGRRPAGRHRLTRPFSSWPSRSASEGGTTLTFQLDFKKNKQHAIGRLRRFGLRRRRPRRRSKPARAFPNRSLRALDIAGREAIATANGRPARLVSASRRRVAKAATRSSQSMPSRSRSRSC